MEAVVIYFASFLSFLDSPCSNLNNSRDIESFEVLLLLIHSQAQCWHSIWTQKQEWNLPSTAMVICHASSTKIKMNRILVVVVIIFHSKETWLEKQRRIQENVTFVSHVTKQQGFVSFNFFKFFPITLRFSIEILRFNFLINSFQYKFQHQNADTDNVPNGKLKTAICSFFSIVMSHVTSLDCNLFVLLFIQSK